MNRYFNLRKIFPFLIFLFASKILANDDVVLKGFVFDSYMHEPIEYATIKVLHLPDSTVIGTGLSDIWEGQQDGSDKKYIGEFNIRVPRLERYVIERFQ